MKLPNHVSESVKKLNPQLFAAVGAVLPPERKQDQKPALVKDPPGKQKVRGSVAVIVSIIACRRRILDSDNAVAACKHLRDCISRSLGIDDADPRIKWCYGQLRTDGEQGTIVKLEWQ